MKYLSIIVVIVAVLIAVLIWKSRESTPSPSDPVTQNNVTVVDGVQIIEIYAKGEYSPAHSTAKAGIPTVLRMVSNGTFDCSSAVRIPRMNISRDLPPTGTTDIDLGTQSVGTLQGTCSMGMYPFEIEFTT